MAEAPRVFLSYSHDSEERADRVLALAYALRDRGIDVILDRFVHPAPAEGWPLWMERNLKAADFVLLVCTETYCRRVRAEETPGQGTGVRWEGRIVYNHLCYGDNPGGSRFIPILLPGAERTHIPDPVRGHNHYQITAFDLSDAGFEDLYRHLTDQSATLKPDLGSIQILPPRPRPQAVPGPLPPSGGPWWNVPYRRNPNFTGREAILKQLETTLASRMPAALLQAIAGLGGVGKTQTAVEYAYRHRDQYRAVLWVRADPGWDRPDLGTNLISGYRELAKVLGLPEKDARNSNEVVEAVRRWLGREPNYLLILDNADVPALVKDYLPPDPKGHVLLTSRAEIFDVLGVRKSIELPVLMPDEALEFLVKRTDRQGLLDPPEEKAARTLAEKLGYLPLALEQAAAYMVKHRESFSVYLAAYDKVPQVEMIEKVGPIGGEYYKTVRTTWKRSFDAVAGCSPASIELLRLSAFFAPDAIPYKLILEGASELGEPLASALASSPLNEVLTPLAEHSLVHRDPAARSDPAARTYSVHRLVQAVLLDELADATCRDFAERAVKALNRTFPDVEYANWPRCERLVPHVLAVWGWIECFDKGFDLRLMSSLNDVSGIPTEGKNLIIVAAETIIVAAVNSVLHFRIFDVDGKVVVDTDEKRLTEQARQIEELRKQLESLWPPHELTSSEKVRVITAVTSIVGRTFDKSKEPLLVPAAAQLLNQAGYYLYLRARYAEAERLHRRALAIWKALGPDNPDTATSLNNLGVLLRFQGRYYGEAEELLPRALAIREAELGPNHPDTAISLNNLALLLQAQGRYGEAEPLLRRALEIREATLRSDHPDIVFTLNDLAGVLRAQGRYYGEAEELLRRALKIREAAVDPDHPDGATIPNVTTNLDTATSLHNLGKLFRDQGRYGEAEPLLRRALAIREQALGPDHPDTATSLNSLGVLLRAQRPTELRLLLKEAEPRLRRALEILEAAVDPDMATSLNTATILDMATSFHNLAQSLRDQVQFKEAEPRLLEEAKQRLRRALEIREATLRSDHPNIAQSLNYLAEVLRAQGRPGEAEPLHRQALKIREATLGPDHPDIAQSLNNLAESLRDQCRYGEAEPRYIRALAIREAALGPKHPKTAFSLNNLALLLQAQGRYGEAEPLLRRALAIFKETLDPEHPYTVCCRENLAKLLTRLNRVRARNSIPGGTWAAFLRSLLSWVCSHQCSGRNN